MHSIHGRAPAIATGLASSRRDLSRVGRHRRRRRAVHRRQPPHPRPAPQRQPEDPAVQQPDLRADQGPVLAPPPRSARSPSRRRWARWTRPSTRSPWPSAPRRPSWPAPSTPTASTSPRCCAQAAAHPGTALVEIYQNCNIFNDGAFEVLKDKQQAEEAVIRLEHGQPIRFGADDGWPKGVVRDPATGDLKVVAVTPENERADPGPRRAHRLPDHRVRPVPARRPRHPAPHPHRRPAQRRPPGLRHADGRPARHRHRAERQGRPGRAARRRRHLDGRRLTPPGRYGTDRRRPTPTPSYGFGEARALQARASPFAWRAFSSSYAWRASSTASIRCSVQPASAFTCSAASRPRSVSE